MNTLLWLFRRLFNIPIRYSVSEDGEQLQIGVRDSIQANKGKGKGGPIVQTQIGGKITLR